MSSVGVDQGPRKNSSPGISIFFIVYIAIAPFFFLNVFIAMITVAFQSEDVNKKKSSGLTNNQVQKLSVIDIILSFSVERKFS